MGYGWGTCQYCGRDVCATKNGLAVRHGFIRVARGEIRTAYPNIPSGRTGHACKGSGQKIKDWFKGEKQ